MTSSRNFVLIHGGWGGGWMWRRVADRLHAPGTIAAIVYLDAFLPEDGKSMADYAPIPRAAHQDVEVSGDADYLIPPIPAAAPRMNAAHVAWLNGHRT